MLAERLAGLFGLTITISVVAAIAHPAGAGDRFTYERANRKDGSSTVKLGAVLPFPWKAKVGVDLGAGARPDAAYESAASMQTTDSAPPSAAWSSVAVPEAGWAWSSASVDARFDAGNESLRLGGRAERRIALPHDLEAVLQTEYSVAQAATDAEPEQSWATSRSLRLNVPATGTALIARNTFASTDEHSHTSLRAEQRIGDSMNLVGSIGDIESENPDARIRLNVHRRW